MAPPGRTDYGCEQGRTTPTRRAGGARVCGARKGNPGSARSCLESDQREDQELAHSRPQPIHGWKQFFNEIAVIVLGILIALGLEQLIERAHWNSQTSEASETLRKELGWNRHSLDIFVKDVPCMLGNVGDLERLTLDGKVAEVRGFFDTHSAVANRIHSFRTLRFGGWEAAKSSGLLAHMTTEERLGFAKVYDSLDRIVSFNKDASLAARRIRTAIYAYDGSQADKRDLLRAIGEYRAMFPEVRFYRDVTMRQIDAIGYDPESATDPNIPTYIQCIRWPSRGNADR